MAPRVHPETALRAARKLEHVPNPVDLIRDLAAEVHRQREVMRRHGIADADAANGDALRLHPFPGNVLQHVENMSEGDSDQDDVQQARRERRRMVTDLDHAMVVTSIAGTTGVRYDHHGRTEFGERLHRPVIDLDMPAKLIPSSTPGHYHLYLDHAMTLERYLKLLDALAEAGIVEGGYARVARERGHTAVRVPWFRKGDRVPELPAELLDAPAGPPEPEPMSSAIGGLVAVPTGTDPWEA